MCKFQALALSAQHAGGSLCAGCAGPDSAPLRPHIVAHLLPANLQDVTFRLGRDSQLWEIRSGSAEHLWQLHGHLCPLFAEDFLENLAVKTYLSRYHAIFLGSALFAKQFPFLFLSDFVEVVKQQLKLQDSAHVELPVAAERPAQQTKQFG